MYESRRLSASSFWVALFSLTLAFMVNSTIAQEKQDTAEEKVDLESLFEEAESDRVNGNFADAAEKLKKYTKLKDDNGAAWHYLGYCLHVEGKLDEAIPAHLKATEFEQFKQLGLYNLGCAYSLKGQTKKSLKYLHEALDSGFNRFDMFESDADLENVRKVDGFKAIQERADNDGKRPEKKSDDKPTKKARNPLVGKWAVKSGERQGDEIGADRLPPEITVRRKDLTIPAGNDEFVMSYKIVEGGDDVIKVDFKIESGPAPEGSALAIMKIKGNKAMLCYDPMGQNRPTEFKTSAENGFFMFVMEKIRKKFDVSKVVGVWNVTEGTRSGEKVTDDRLAEAKITFGKDKITIPAGDDEFVMSYEINADKSPVEIDMKIDSGPAPEGSPAIGIIKFQGGKFILCYNATGGDRPKKFESTEEDGNFLFTMEADKE